MFTFNNYNPFKAIADEVTSNRFKSWVQHKAQNDFQFTLDAALGSIGLAIQVATPVINAISQVSDYTINQGKLCAVIVNDAPAASEIGVNGLASAIYKAGRYAYESGALLAAQIRAGYWEGGMLTPVVPLALPESNTLELLPPTPGIVAEALALPYSVDTTLGMTFQEWVMSILGEITLAEITAAITKRTLQKALRQGGVAVPSRARKGELIKLF